MYDFEECCKLSMTSPGLEEVTAFLTFLAVRACWDYMCFMGHLSCLVCLKEGVCVGRLSVKFV